MIIKQYPAGIVKTSKLRLLFCEACGARNEFMVKMISKEKNMYKRNHRNGVETERPVTEEKIYWLCYKCLELAMPGQDKTKLRRLYQAEEDDK
jgi:hypothetical protein